MRRDRGEMISLRLDFHQVEIDPLVLIHATGLELFQVGQNQALGVGQHLLFHFHAIRFTLLQEHLQGCIDLGQAFSSLL